MKRILITGADSYIGESFRDWLAAWQGDYAVDTLDLRERDWQLHSFSGYAAVLHVAAIVHVRERDAARYYAVNRDLALETALKAKAAGVKQFIFMSTMGVYDNGLRCIERPDQVKPKTEYQKSKLEAEQAICPLRGENFHVAVVRAPFVYGRGCKGNYQRLRGLALRLGVFPNVSNERSMLYIRTLCAFLQGLVDAGESGLFHPQDAGYVSTAEMFRLIRAAHGKSLWLFTMPRFLVRLLCRISVFRKLLGDHVYDPVLSRCAWAYQTVGLEQAVYESEGQEVPAAAASARVN